MYQATGIWVNKRIEKLPNVILENGPSALETLLNELSEAESHEISASSDVKSTNMVVKLDCWSRSTNFFIFPTL